MNTFKMEKNAQEIYAAVLAEIVNLVKFEELCEIMPQYEKGRLDAFRDMGLFISCSKEWNK